MIHADSGEFPPAFRPALDAKGLHRRAKLTEPSGPAASRTGGGLAHGTQRRKAARRTPENCFFGPRSSPAARRIKRLAIQSKTSLPTCCPFVVHLRFTRRASSLMPD
jgi:hypothetical protein